MAFECISAVNMARLTSGLVSPAEQSLLLDHVLQCPSCYREYLALLEFDFAHHADHDTTHHEGFALHDHDHETADAEPDSHDDELHHPGHVHPQTPSKQAGKDAEYPDRDLPPGDDNDHQGEHHDDHHHHTDHEDLHDLHTDEFDETNSDH